MAAELREPDAPFPGPVDALAAAPIPCRNDGGPPKEYASTDLPVLPTCHEKRLSGNYPSGTNLEEGRSS
jgi:hypothetical protein